MVIPQILKSYLMFVHKAKKSLKVINGGKYNLWIVFTDNLE